ncbi:MAG: homoserine kinase [Cyanobacteria bacterium CRU_2_1]|nr:homoserine kinase [Cyanobacteria bacterium RU_5_0]NJR57708.1 homoserine kinase [Cyanobacteria bacterium CRU_2_1]
MSVLSIVTVTIPATTANLGPGFDCIGAALTLHNQFEFSLLPSEAEKSLTIEVTGIEAERVSLDEHNLAYRAFVHFYQQIGQIPPAIRLSIALSVPLARGLGSSATAILGGLIGANQLAGSPVSQDAVMAMAIALEGHPDNVVPALMGGCRLVATHPNGTWTICDVPWHEGVVPIVAIPDFELSTAEARRVLPPDYSRADAIFNMAHLGALLRGLATGRADWLRTALQDRIHQPYRQPLIRGFNAVENAALEAGAYGLVISGAGPTLLALAHPSQAAAVESAMTIAWAHEGVIVQVHQLQLDMNGAIVH